MSDTKTSAEARRRGEPGPSTEARRRSEPGPSTEARRRSEPGPSTEAPEQMPARRIRRTLLGALSAVVSINIWTGSPLLAVWLGSRFQRVASGPSMAAIVIVLVALVVQSLILVRLLAALNRSYDALVGKDAVRWQSPWLRSLGSERASTVRTRPLTIVERVVVLSVVVAIGAFEVWFFFFAGSSLPHS